MVTEPEVQARDTVRCPECRSVLVWLPGFNPPPAAPMWIVCASCQHKFLLPEPTKLLTLYSDGTPRGTRITLADGSSLPFIKAAWQSGASPDEEPTLTLTCYAFRLGPILLEIPLDRVAIDAVCQHCGQSVGSVAAS